MQIRRYETLSFSACNEYIQGLYLQVLTPFFFVTTVGILDETHSDHPRSSQGAQHQLLCTFPSKPPSCLDSCVKNTFVCADLLQGSAYKTNKCMTQDSWVKRETMPLCNLDCLNSFLSALLFCSLTSDANRSVNFYMTSGSTEKTQKQPQKKPKSSRLKIPMLQASLSCSRGHPLLNFCPSWASIHSILYCSAVQSPKCSGGPSQSPSPHATPGPH